MKNLSTKNGTQWTSISACRNNLYILKKDPQTPWDSFGMMVWGHLVWYKMTWYGMVTWYWYGTMVLVWCSYTTLGMGTMEVPLNRLSVYSGKRSHLVTVLNGILGVIYRKTACFWPSHPFILPLPADYTHTHSNCTHCSNNNLSISQMFLGRVIRSQIAINLI